MQQLVAPGSQGEAIGRLVVAGLLVAMLPALPFGNYLAYPFYILTTWFHEMGHGLTAMVLGQSFHQLVIFPNGSGYAEYSLGGSASRLVPAAIAAGGPLAPSMVGALLIVASAHPRAWRPVLWLVLAAILLSTLIWVRSATGWWALLVVAGVLGLVAWRGSPSVDRFTLQFLGLLGVYSGFGDWRYLFTERVTMNGQAVLSDTGAIAAAIGPPYWFWAGVILVASAIMVGAALRYALADKRLRPPPRKPPANVLQFRR
ncbi:M50 family metallopeptidase [Porphyrobacter sp. YT40]|uniref:M50 family metallopeptidase n=1 Tax=Porphyrobacter sp. YT40 TaxID=2547601 RepID=UPI001144CD59|nr:M50 family metallopeptidase [Porphyrobacter sp. YT40]QDH33763.1 M50 family metallopeptidase [Porphyrobacter sp. YT40]